MSKERDRIADGTIAIADYLDTLRKKLLVGSAGYESCGLERKESRREPEGFWRSPRKLSLHELDRDES